VNGLGLRRTAILAAALAIGALPALPAGAQTLYKLIDKNGKVTYSEKPPKDFDGKVIRIDVNPNANTATMPRPGATFQPGAAPRGSGGATRGQEARAKLDAARKALQDAKDNPREGEVQWLGNKGGGTRRVETEEYRKRIAALEDDVRKAEEELRLAGPGR